MNRQLYEPILVDLSIKTELLRVMAQYQSHFIWEYVLETVAMKLLLERYPLETTYPWFAGEPFPDTIRERYRSGTDRRLLYWFWDSLGKLGVYDQLHERLPIGMNKVESHVIEDILTRLTIRPFEAAINTWLAVCEEWLQICNIDWYDEQVKQHGWPIWKKGEERDIPKYLAGVMAQAYF